MCLPLGQLYLEAKDFNKSTTILKRALIFAPNPCILYLISQKLERVQKLILNPEDLISEPKIIPKQDPK
jgi:hypothetical protein